MAAPAMSARAARVIAVLAIAAGLAVAVCGVMLPMTWRPSTPGVTWMRTAVATPGAWPVAVGKGQVASSPVSLPDPWRLSGRAEVWTYHLALPEDSAVPGVRALTARNVTQGLWMPRVSTVVAIWLDDQLIAGMDKSAFTAEDKPWLLSLPQVPSGARHRQVHIVVAGHGERASGLSSIAYGSLSTLESLHEARQTMLVGSSLSVFSSTLVMSIAAGWVAYHLRSRAVALFMCVTLLMAIREALVFWGSGWFSAHILESLVYASAGTAILVSVFMLLRYVGHRAPLWEVSSAGVLLMGPPALVASLMDCSVSREAMWLWYCMSHGVWLGTTVIVAVQILKSPSAKRSLILLSAMGVTAFTLLDDWHAFISTAPSSYEFLRLAPAASVSALLAVVVTTYIRVFGALVAEERFKVDLQAEVDRQRLELERLHAAMQEKTRAEIASRVRTSIARDLHDGLGSQLVHILSDVESGDLAKASLVDELNDLLDQLRLTMDALDPVAKDVSDLLAQIRYRLKDRWRRAGIMLTWSIEPLASDRSFTPEELASLQRMLYEIFTNIIKHARAGSVSIHTFTDPARNMCGIVVADDGVGFSPAFEHAGRGLHNIAARAREMNLHMHLESEPGRGARLSLGWPLRQS